MEDAGLVQVEQQRQELEANISKLRKSLQHWQTWEIEYDGLREEIASLPPGSNKKDILAVAKDFGARLVDEKELESIVGGDRGPLREQSQIVSLLTKRVDYVSRNARTLENLVSDAQRKRRALSLAEAADFEEDAALPLAEIVEEMDDKGNVVSSRVETPGSAAPQLADVLKKAGVDDMAEPDDIRSNSEDSIRNAKSSEPKPTAEMTRPPSESPLEVLGTVKEANAQKFSELTTDAIELGEVLRDDESHSKQEGRSFSDSSKVDNPLRSKMPVSQCKTDARPIAAESEDYGKRETNVSENTAVCADDTPEEAALRSEMVQYGLGEVGAIVAELDLEDGGSDATSGDDEADFSFDSDFDEDDSEDETGMAKRPALSRKYLAKMKMLETKHGIKAMQNLGPDASNLPTDVQKTLENPSAIQAASDATLDRDKEAAQVARAGPKQPKKVSDKPQKRVSFAQDLDIALEKRPESKIRKRSNVRPERLNLVEPIADQIVEHQTPTTSADGAQAATPATERSPSRFKIAREATPQTPLLPPSPTSRALPGSSVDGTADSMSAPPKTHSHIVIERDIITNPKPPDPDDIDDGIHHQEIASEYHKLRNRMIQRQGGFVGSGEAENYDEELRPLPMIDEDGKEKKISRFRAARLR